MSNTNNSNNNENNNVEKKNFTEILSDKAEKAGEATADAVNHFTEMLTNKDKNDSKDEVDLNTSDNKESSHTCINCKSSNASHFSLALLKYSEYSALSVPPIHNRIPLVRDSVPPCF